MNKEKIFIRIYIFILIIELSSTTFALPKFLHFIAKPLLVISLLYYFLNYIQPNKKNKKFIVLALVFSLIGDFLLMFVHIEASLFIFGLITFLIAHIMYIIAFSKEQNKTLTQFLTSIFLLIYGVLIFMFLSSHLGNLIVPVGIYILVILIMVLFASLRKNNVNQKSYSLVLIGSLFFVASDSLLAINKFHTPIPIPNILVITTYAVAQLLIIIGIGKAPYPKV